MKAYIGKDEVTPALARLINNLSPANRTQILGRVAFACATQQKRNIAAELQFDGKPMKSPAKETKFNRRFAKSYNWRYREGYKLADEDEQYDYKNFKSIGGGRGRDFKFREGRNGKKRLMTRRRIAVTAASKQLQDTGATIKSIDILSCDAYRARVGPKTGHGQLILSVHDSTRHPLGMSNEFKEKARKMAMDEIWKGV